MTPQEYDAALRADGESLAVAAERDLTATVPWCGEWTVADLVRHTGDVHRHKQTLLEIGGTERPRGLSWPPAPPGDEALLTWYREGVHLLASRLQERDPQEPVWSWAGDHRVAFWQRRMAQETLVHRWDAEAAVGEPAPLDPALAGDGVDEYLHVMLASQARRGQPYGGPAGTVHLHRSDGPGEWLVDLSVDPPAVHRAHAKAGAAARGRAEDLLLALWRRRGLDTLEVFGERVLLDAFVGWPQL
ncbi:MAG: maleylpyruvate isomerase family mycothiol-dependent enzyme [Euzebyales bacterium]|nr:maleylpyruvate isomerase family mycothiol-dependent enzyme [Euzebyales bacterium]